MKTLQTLRDLHSAYSGLTLSRKDSEWEGQVRTNAKAAIDAIAAALDSIHDWTKAPGSRPDPAEVAKLLRSIL